MTRTRKPIGRQRLFLRPQLLIMEEEDPDIRVPTRTPPVIRTLTEALADMPDTRVRLPYY